MSVSSRKVGFGGPGLYRVVVQGAIPESYMPRLAGMSLARDDDGSLRRSVLMGEMRDQAELSGVLETLYGLHLTLLEVTRVGCERE